MMGKKILRMLSVFTLIMMTYMFLSAKKRWSSIVHSKSEDVLRLGLKGSWKLPLTPSSQHMMIEDAILSNQFESLVVRGENGLVVPEAAKSFSVNENFTVYDFIIDDTKRFSDGSALTANDFKRSWERGLELRKNSANKNAEDVLSQVIGFENLGANGHLIGIEVVDRYHLRVQFSKPFRMALMHLTGARFAAFREDGLNLIGTGRYVMEPISDEKVILHRNNYHPDSQTGFSRIEILGLKDPLKAIEAGDIDLVAFYSYKFQDTNEIKSTFEIEDFSGWFHLNGLQGRFFSDIRLRQAFQFLVNDILKQEKKRLDALPAALKTDLQTFLPLQAGRISTDLVEEIIQKGSKYVDDLVIKSRQHPIKTTFYGSYLFMVEELAKRGVVVENMDFDTDPGLMNDFYIEHTRDVLQMGASVHLSDPDGQYHLLGKFGAITSPMIQRHRVAELFEKGRSITDQNEISPHYEEASKAILEEVPGVHLYFGSHRYLYRKSKVVADKRLLERHFDQIARVFHPVD